MQMWLLGRQKPLRVYGLHHCLHRTRDLMESFMVETWPNFFPIEFFPIPEHDRMPVLDSPDFRITSWPTRHFIPTIGLRIEVKTTGKIVGYSCDTEPIPGVVELAQHAYLLLHEAAGEGLGHSSAAQAGEIASEAGADRLALIHYNVINADPHVLIDEAQLTFAGPVELAQDNQVYEI
jgi:ribonuclease Z